MKRFVLLGGLIMSINTLFAQSKTELFTFLADATHTVDKVIATYNYHQYNSNINSENPLTALAVNKKWNKLTDHFVDLIQKVNSTKMDASRHQNIIENLHLTIGLYVDKLFVLSASNADYFDHIIRISDEVLQYAPEDESFLIDKSRALVLMGAHDDAVEVLNYIQKTNPMNVESLRFLADIYLNKDMLNTASAYFQKLQLYGNQKDKEIAEQALMGIRK